MTGIGRAFCRLSSRRDAFGPASLLRFRLPRVGRFRSPLLEVALGLALMGAPSLASAQVLAEPVLQGRVLVNGAPDDAGTVVLHHVSTESQGEVDSIRTSVDGSFSFPLPTVPDPERGDVYFASIRYDGVMYFGSAVNLAVQLDSVYEIQAWDTVTAPASGLPLVIQARNTFLEEVEGQDGWQVTDLFQVRNDRDRTIVAREGGAVWRYPLAVGSRGHEVGQDGLMADGVAFEGEEVVVSTALSPGERLFVVRYMVDDPFIELPAPGLTETIEVLVREPAPALTVPTLTPAQSVELELGSTYRRFSGQGLQDARVGIEETEGPSRMPVEWVAVLLALILTGFGVAAVSRTAPVTRPASPEPGDSRDSLLLEIARMDEAFERLPEPSGDDRIAYDRRRRELLRRLRALS